MTDPMERLRNNPGRKALAERVLADSQPTHLVREPGDKKALCGTKNPLPRMWVEAAPKHQYPFNKCPECYRLAGLDG